MGAPILISGIRRLQLRPPASTDGLSEENMKSQEGTYHGIQFNCRPATARKHCSKADKGGKQTKSIISRQKEWKTSKQKEYWGKISLSWSTTEN